MNEEIYAVLNGGYLDRRKGKFWLLHMGLFWDGLSLLRLWSCRRGLQAGEWHVEVEEHLHETAANPGGTAHDWRQAAVSDNPTSEWTSGAFGGIQDPFN